jgi:endonuclease III
MSVPQKNILNKWILMVNVKNDTCNALRMFEIIRNAVNDVPDPMSVVIAREYDKDPYLLLMSCLLSLRAKDEKTLPVVRDLFEKARTPQEMINLPLSQLMNIIYSIGFYQNKSRILQRVSQELLDRFDGKVPHNRDDLMSIKGVGAKTASLVLSMAFDIPAVCVDVHVHRLSNMLGWVHTRTPEDTERALETLFPQHYWIDLNHVLVKLGQNLRTIVPKLPRDIQLRLTPLMPKKYRIVAD